MSRYTGDAAMRRTEDIEDTMADYFGLGKQASNQTSNSNSKKNEEKQHVSIVNPLFFANGYADLSLISIQYKRLN